MKQPRETKEKIARTTIELVAARGVDAVSMRDIAQIVGVSEAAVYRHFPSKSSLIWEVFTTNYEIFAAKLDNIQRPHASLEAKLDAMIKVCCAIFDDDRALFTFLLLAQHVQRFGPAGYRAALPLTVASLIGDGIESGEIADIDTELTTAMVMGCVLQTALFCLYNKSQPKYMSPLSQELSDACWRIVKGN